jgi:hypothetical protein
MGVDDGAPVSVAGQAVRFTYGGRYEEVTYAADATADWNGYAVDVTLRRLAESRGDSASVLVRVGSDQALTTRVSARSVTITKTQGSGPSVLRHSRLFPAATHHLHIVVGSGRTLVTIDHLVTLAVPSPGGIRSAGGIGLAALRKSIRAEWPMFSQLTVRPATAASSGADRAQPLALSAPFPPAAGSLWVKSRFAPAAVTATAHTLRFTAATLRDFAQYAPARTANWIDYSFSATVKDLLPGGSVGVYGRMGSKSQAIAIVSDHSIRVFSGSQGSRKVVASHVLARRTSHRLTLRVLRRTTFVQADGLTVASLPVIPGTAGGVGVRARRNPGQPWPHLDGIAVTPAR